MDRLKTGPFCRGEGCPRADLCRRHMDAPHADRLTYFEVSPVAADGQCTEFVANGWERADPLRCGGAHPPPACACQCSIELHRWEQRADGEWIYLDGAVH